MPTTTAYKPVPVEEAKRIAELYDKGMVIINSYDDARQLTHTTTYGKTVEQKEIAADAGERTAKALGCSIEEKKSYEDFRHRTAAEAAKYLETLKAIQMRCNVVVDTDPFQTICAIKMLVEKTFS